VPGADFFLFFPNSTASELLNRRRPTFQNGVPGLSSIDRQVIQEITEPRNLQGAGDDFEPTVDFAFGLENGFLRARFADAKASLQAHCAGAALRSLGVSDLTEGRTVVTMSLVGSRRFEDCVREGIGFHDHGSWG
jgi:hypothetical protein